MRFFQWCPTLLWPHGLQPARLLCPWDFPGQNIGVGCHFLLQETFWTKGSNLHLLLDRWILHHCTIWEAKYHSTMLLSFPQLPRFPNALICSPRRNLKKYKIIISTKLWKVLYLSSKYKINKKWSNENDGKWGKNVEETRAVSEEVYQNWVMAKLYSFYFVHSLNFHCKMQNKVIYIYIYIYSI